MRIVIDTNVVASGVFFGGSPQRLLQGAVTKQFDVFVSEDIVNEYYEIIGRLSEKYPDLPKKLPLEPFVSSCVQVSPSKKFEICRDPDDDKFISCAVEAKCLYIVSGDKDLLSLEKVENVESVTVADFLARLSDEA